MRIVVVGGGKIGKGLTEMLSDEKNDVVLIEEDEKRAEELAEQLDALVLHGDATEKEVLKDADMEKCDALVAVTGDDKTNLIVCETAESLDVKKVVSRVNETGNEELFRKSGIPSLVNTTVSTIMEFKKALEGGRQAFGLFGGGAEIAELYVKPESKIINRTVESLLKDGIVVVSIKRKDKLILPRQKTEIREKDLTAVCIPAKGKRKLERLFGV